MSGQFEPLATQGAPQGTAAGGTLAQERGTPGQAGTPGLGAVYDICLLYTSPSPRDRG